MAQTTLINSASNIQFRLWKSLLTSKGIKENKMFLLSGKKLVDEFLADPAPGFTPLFLVGEDESKMAVDLRKTVLSHDLFKEIDVLGTKSPLLVLSFSDFPEARLALKPDGLELICPLGDPRNLGALCRTAVGFGVRRIVLTKESAHPFLPQSVKASAGAVLRMDFAASSSALAEIDVHENDCALALHGDNIAQFRWPKNLRLWVGEEGPGLSLTLEQKRKLKFINIPTENIESLNAMVSTSIALWEWKKKNS